MTRNLFFFLSLFSGIIQACQNEQPAIKSTYHFQAPHYDSIALVPLPDTIHFVLKDDVFSTIRSFNLFYQNNKAFISFYDDRSQTINFYKFSNQRRYSKFKLKKLFKKEKLYKTSIYINNFDSIFIVNNENLYLYDTSGQQKNRIALLEPSRVARAKLDNNFPLITKGTSAFAAVGSSPDQKSIDALRKWQVLYEFNLNKNKATLHYPLPELYHKNLYGRHFLDYNYCYNNRRHFVFSFPADTTLYETDLHNFHQSYFARSSFQHEAIPPVGKEELEKEKGRKEYSLRYSYGSVFFDPFRKYYLRLVKHKVSEAEYAVKARRKETVLIFNENLAIIGECDWVSGIDFDSLFFTNDGQLYGRTNFRDENALHFVKLTFKTSDSLNTKFASR